MSELIYHFPLGLPTFGVRIYYATACGIESNRCTWENEYVNCKKCLKSMQKGIQHSGFFKKTKKGKDNG